MIKETSKKALAALEESGKAGVQRYRILKFMDNHPRRQGWTRSELSQRLEIPINVICGRVNDLLDAGIEVIGRKVCMVTAKYVEALKIVI